MISEILVPALLQRFPDRGIRTGVPPDPIAIFPAADARVGDVHIWDDGDEATVAIGSLTHTHFNPYDQTLSPQRVAERVTEDVIQFLKDLSSGQVGVAS
jgi:hypothetical protein